MIFSRSSTVLKTALREASVVMLRVMRRGGVTSTSSREVLRFWWLRQDCARSNHEDE